MPLPLLLPSGTFFLKGYLGSGLKLLSISGRAELDIVDNKQGLGVEGSEEEEEGRGRHPLRAFLWTAGATVCAAEEGCPLAHGICF